MNILWDADPSAIEKYRFALGESTQPFDSAAAVARALHESEAIEQVVIGPEVPLDSACELAEAARLDRPALGVILLRHRVDVVSLSSALRSGVREVVAAEETTALSDALRRSSDLTARLVGQQPGGGKEGHVVTVFSAKGGVGKTTLSTNLAVHFAMRGLRTLLIDLDLAFGDVAISLQLVPTRSVHDAISMGGRLDEKGLESLVTVHPSTGLEVVCAPTNPADADRIPVSVVSELIKVARRTYDYVVVDTPPSFTEHVLTACDLSDALVLIATLDIPAVKNLRVALDTLDMLGSPKEARVIVLNRADSKVGLRAEDVVTAIKLPIAINIPSSMTVPASVNRGVAIVQHDPRDVVSLAIKELADVHIRSRFEDLPANGRAAVHGRRRSLFGGRR
ncbi:MAG: CpaE family protein [Ornithinibacter sp.]